LITRARKLLSGTFVLIFKSVKAKKTWQEQEALVAMFRAFIKTTEFIFNVIVFSFFKEAISKVTLNKRLKAIIN
jgi:hypothetical protein